MVLIMLAMKTIKKPVFLNFLAILLFVPFLGIGQVTFSKIPLDKQLIARSTSTNLGNFEVVGQVNDA